MPRGIVARKIRLLSTFKAVGKQCVVWLYMVISISMFSGPRMQLS